MVAEDDTMNFSSFEGNDINQKEIIDLAETLPFFADRRMILIEDSGPCAGLCLCTEHVSESDCSLCRQHRGY